MLKTEDLKYSASKTNNKERIRWELPDAKKLLRTYLDKPVGKYDVKLEIYDWKAAVFEAKLFEGDFLRSDDNLDREINKYYQEFLDSIKK